MLTERVSEGAIAPVSIPEEDLEGFSAARPLPMKVAQLWASHGTRARSWLPRQIGRVFGAGWRIFVATDGDKLAVDPHNLDVYTAIVRDRGHEPWILRTCLRLIRQGDAFYDIGANAGYFSIGVARRVPDVRVVALEPQPTLARAIAISAALNGLDNVLVLPAMLGAREGSAKLFVPNHSVHASAVAPSSKARSLACPVTTLADLVGRHLLPWPTLVKIDVEGAELEVLKGGNRLLRENPPYLVFESNEHAGRFGYDRSDLLNYILSLGNFTFFAINPDGSLFRLSSAFSNAHVPDLLAVPSNKASPASYG
jgi:FkbM family methyltransferase